MTDPLRATVRRVDFEPKPDSSSTTGARTWAHVFLTPREGHEVDAFTDDPSLEAAVLAAFRPFPNPDSPDFPPLIEVEIAQVQGVNRLIRVTLDYSFV
jgi:hypothetical protein